MSEGNNNDSVGSVPNSAPVLCANGCGFFGNRLTQDMCSKCYRDHTLAKKQKEGETSDKEVVQPAKASTATEAAAEPALATEAATTADVTPAASTATAPARPVQKNTSRCFKCNKKIGLTGFKCRCEYFFCATHRYSEKHECDFDYKTHGRQELSKNNPQIVAEKVSKI